MNRPTGFGRATAASPFVRRDSAPPPPAPQSWIPVDRIEITDPSITSIATTTIDGDADDTYFITYRLRMLAQTSIFLRPNNAAAGQFHAMQNNGIGVNDAFIGVNSGGVGDWVPGFVWWHAARTTMTNKARRYWQGQFGWGNTSIVESRTVNGVWDDVVNNITFFTLTAGSANAIGEGSIITLWKSKFIL